jgi:23S rRNA (cytidine1920-2'-O)/16S rRNA (cytidine1409-2'-O)-methyltransferase
VATRRRLDAELVRRGLAASRTDAQVSVAAGRVLVNGAVADKPARLVAAGDAVVVQGPPARFVGRGGEKLDAALDAFALDVGGLDALDVGASTGGFTDCLLSRGARRVVALDVGHGQLHPRIRADPRVVVLERTNVRDATPATIGGLVDVVVVDVSFISLTVIIPVLVTLCQPGSPMVLLVKPQFEAGRAEVSRARGVITDPTVHDRVQGEVAAALGAAGCDVVGWIDSPLRGGEGNRELLVHARTGADRARPDGVGEDRR